MLLMYYSLKMDAEVKDACKRQDNLFFSKKKRKMKLLTIKQQKPYENAQISNICQTNEGKYV